MTSHQFTTIDEVIEHHAHIQPAMTALICNGRELTYAELRENSRALAGALQHQGLTPGARVAYLGLESIEYYAALFACAAAGYVLVPINFRLTAHEIAHIMSDSQASILLVDDSLRDVAFASLGAETSVDVRGTDPATIGDWTAGWGAPDPVGHDTETPAVMLYTSGTTGLPKGVVLAHRSFFAIRDLLAAAGSDWIDWRVGDVSLIGIPGFHVGGLWWAMQGFAAGATNVALPRWDSASAVEVISRHRVTTMCVVPAMLAQTLAEPRARSAPMTSLRKIVYGGSPISEAVLEEAMALFGCEFGQIYGLTETGNTAIFLPPGEHRAGGRRLRAAGRPYPGVGVIIADDQGASLPVGGVGEVWVHTPAAMLGYWNRPEATAATLTDGWIHTGDGGYLDDEGYLFICDRIKDMIIVGGENVYPAEVENGLVTHAGVADAAVLGMADEVFGERVVAYVALHPGAMVSPRELFDHCRTRLAGFKVPSRFHIIDAIPRNPSGKILRRLLVETPQDGSAPQRAHRRTSTP